MGGPELTVREGVLDQVHPQPLVPHPLRNVPLDLQTWVVTETGPWVPTLGDYSPQSPCSPGSVQ